MPNKNNTIDLSKFSDKIQSVKTNHSCEAEKLDKIWLPEEYVLNAEFEKCYRYIIDDVPFVLLIGGAGTGKSTFINYLQKNLKKDTDKTCVVLAPTGVAALNIQGQTIHSFFHFDGKKFDDSEIDNKKKNPIVDKINLIIIDEFSMVESDLIDHIDYALRKWRNSNKPFGGIQILLMGDPFQLPPIKVHGNEASKFLAKWDSQYFYAAHIFEVLGDNVAAVILKQKYRQSENTEAEFIEYLDAIRTCENEVAKNNAIEKLNEKCFIKNELKSIFEDSLFLTATNDIAEIYNNKKLNELINIGKKSVRYIANVHKVSNDTVEKIATPEKLDLCEGAKVIVTKNIYDNNNNLRLVNGTIGIVTKLKEYSVEIKVDNKIEELFPQKWELFSYVWNEEKDTIASKTEGFFIQIPLRLGWAVTIHKSQGMTLDSVVIDAEDSFESGQVYVALSRCKKMSGVHLKSPLDPKKVYVDKDIKLLYKLVMQEC